jgi:hypothetical protein
VPGRHEDADDCPTMFTKVPGGASVQNVDPAEALNVPTGHSVNEDEPTELTKEPGGASRQLDCPDMGL